jgi:hypothetical protein
MTLQSSFSCERLLTFLDTSSDITVSAIKPPAFYAAFDLANLGDTRFPFVHCDPMVTDNQARVYGAHH